MLSKLLIAAVAAVAASSPEPVAVSRDAVAAKVNSLTSAVTESASKLERHERASVTRERMAQWTNFIADVEEHIPELLQDTATVAGASAQLYEPLDFPAFVAAAPPATSTWNPFEPWLVQLKAYRTYMANYIDYQITWVYKLKCTFTGDCNVHTTMAYAPAGATKIVLASTAGIEKDAKLMIPGTTSSATSFLETSTGSSTCYTVSAVSGQTVTLTTGLAKEMAADTAVTKSTACLAASPSPAAAANFGASELIVLQGTAPFVTAAATVTGTDGTTTASLFTPLATLSGAMSSAGAGDLLSTAGAGAASAFILKFTPKSAVAAGKFIQLTFKGSSAASDTAKGCRYSGSADASTVFPAITSGKIITVGGTSGAYTYTAESTNFKAFGATAGTDTTAYAAVASTSNGFIELVVNTALTAGTTYTIAIQGASDTAANGLTTIFTPPTGSYCEKNSDQITLKACTTAGTSGCATTSDTVIAETAITLSPASASA